MHRLDVHERDFSEDVTWLIPTSSDFCPSIHFPLRELYWSLTKTNLSFLSPFISSNLVKIDIKTKGAWLEEVPAEVVQGMCPAIRNFPSVQFLSIYLGNGREPRLKKEISSFILGRGESLREFHSNLVLSTEALVHLMCLPNLRAWTTKQEPPQTTDLVLHQVPDGATHFFPSLEVLELRSEPTLKWLLTFAAAKNCDLPWTMTRNRLLKLTLAPPVLTIDSTLLSGFLSGTNLVQIFTELECFTWRDACESQLTDRAVEALAIALPRLEHLELGKWPCNARPCPTTVLSLLFLSIHCTNLKRLNIHFRTTDMPVDIVTMLDYAYSHNLHRKPKCALKKLSMGYRTFPFLDDEFEIISMGMVMILPSLTRFESHRGWRRLEPIITTFRTLEESGYKMWTIIEISGGLGLLAEPECGVPFLVSPPPGRVGSIAIFIRIIHRPFPQESMAYLIHNVFAPAAQGKSLHMILAVFIGTIIAVLTRILPKCAVSFILACVEDFVEG